MKRYQRWKDLERTAARKLRGRRIVRQDFFESSPDVIVEDFGLRAECKAYRRFSFHGHMRPALRYCPSGEIPALVTKAEGQCGEYYAAPLDWLARLLDEVRAARKGDQQ